MDGTAPGWHKTHVSLGRGGVIAHEVHHGGTQDTEKEKNWCATRAIPCSSVLSMPPS